MPRMFIFKKSHIKLKQTFSERAMPKWVTKSCDNSCDNRCDEVYGWNSIQDMANCLDFYPFLGKFYFDLRLRLSALGSLNAPYWVVSWYQVLKYEVCRWNIIRGMASLVFYPFLEKFDRDLWHWHLGHWMLLIGLYLDSKYKVCRWNSIRNMASSLVFYPFWGKFDLDLWPWPWPMVK